MGLFREIEDEAGRGWATFKLLPGKKGEEHSRKRSRARAAGAPRAHLQEASVVLVLQDKSALSVVFVPIQLHNKRFLVYV